MLDTAFVGAAAGGGGGGSYGVSFSPDGGAYTIGMSVDVDWTSRPTGAALIRVRRYYSTNGGASWTSIGDTFFGYPTGPGTVTLTDASLPPGAIQRLAVNFVDGSYNPLLGSEINSANFV